MFMEVLLSLAPMALTYPAWRFQRKLDPPLSVPRVLLFRCGLFPGALCSLAVVCSWFHPFPLLPDGQGGYSDVRNFILLMASVSAALLTIGLALFGRGASRLLLAGSGFLPAIVGYGAVLSNG